MEQSPTSARSVSTFRRRRSTISAGRIAATRWPSRSSSTIRSQGVQLATMQELARYWATDYDWRKCEATLNALPQFTTEIDGRGHPLHPREVAARERVAADHDARLARLGHRAARDRRPADRPDRARRDAPRTRSTWCCRPFPATASPASRPSSAGTPAASRRRGRSSCAASATPATSPRAATWAPPSPTRWAARRPKG